MEPTPTPKTSLAASKQGKTQEGPRQALIFYEQSKADLKQARHFQKKGESEKCILMSVQAAVNCLSSVCLANHRLQNPTYNLCDMLKICAKEYEEFQQLHASCEALDSIQDYKLFKHHVKGGRNITPETTRDFLQHSVTVVSGTTELIRKHQIFKIPFSISSFFN